LTASPTATPGPHDFADDPETHDTWFRARVREALDDPRRDIPGDEVETYFAERRANALARTDKG
jgi:DNA-damage-inducible protein J